MNPVLVGALGIGAVVAVFVGAVAVTSGGGDETLVGTPYGWDDLRVGHCIEGLDFTQDPVVVPCTEPHRGEVVLAEDRFFAEAASMPTEDEFNERIGNACYDALVLYSELAYDNSAYEYRPHIPTASKWADGDRSLICVGSIPGEYEIRHSMRGN